MLKRKISANILDIKEKLGLPFYMNQRKFSAEYSVKIKSLADNNAVTAILPVPENISGQEIIETPSFNLLPAQKGTDNIYGNKYASWHLDMKKNEEVEIIENFKIRTRPFALSGKNVFQVSDYKKNKEYKLYCRPNGLIHPEDSRVKHLAGQIAGNQKKDVIKVLKAINGHIVNNLKYGQPIEGLYSDLDALTKPEVDCGGFASLYVSLAIACGIPSRIVSGFWAGYENNTMHAWAESMLPDGTWLPADPATQQLRKLGRTKKFGGFGKVGSDRIILSKGCDLKLVSGADNLNISILQNPLINPGKGELSIQIKCEFSAKIINNN